MSVYIEALSFDAAKTSWDLHIEAELEANLSFAGSIQSAQLDDFAQAKDNVEEVVLGLIKLQSILFFVSLIL